MLRTLSLISWLAAVALPAAAPRPQDPKPIAPRPTPAQAMAAVESWLASAERDEAELKRVSGLVCASGEAAIGALAQRIRRAPTDAVRLRQGLDGVLTSVGVEFLEREGARGVIFAGQFDPLRPLQPWVGQLYLKLLLDPPDWFPDTERARLVPALRDLFPEPPPTEDISRIEALADDVAREPEVLRLQLSFALAQWGQPERAERVLADLRRQCADPDPDARLYPLHFLADVHYQMRAYAKAQAVHAQYLSLAQEREHPVRPIDFYNAACCANLAGDLEQAVAWLRRCAALQGSDEVDASLKLERSMFLEDPELAMVRQDARFAEIFRTAFPARGGGRF